MNLLVSNFFKFLNYELRGVQNFHKFNFERAYSEGYDDYSSVHDPKDLELDSRMNSFLESEDYMDLNFKSHERSSRGSKDGSKYSKENDYLNTDSLADSIPENMLSHMASLPLFFEKLVYHSVGICFDALLFELTFMPIQAITTVSHIISKSGLYVVNELRYLVINELLRPVLGLLGLKNWGLSTSSTPRFSSRTRDENYYESYRTVGTKEEFRKWYRESNRKNFEENSLTPTEVCGFVRFMVLMATICIFSLVDTSKVYHNIKGQPFMKLYVIFNILEICERLCRSFSRDIMDSLIRTTIRIYFKEDEDREDYASDSHRRYGYRTDLLGNEALRRIEFRYFSKGFPPEKSFSCNFSLRNCLLNSDNLLSYFPFKKKEKEVKPPKLEKDTDKVDKTDNMTLKKQKHKEETGSKRLVQDKKKKGRSSNEEKKQELESENKDFEFFSEEGSIKSFTETNYHTEKRNSILDSYRKYIENLNVYYKFLFLYSSVVLTVCFHSFLHLVRVLSLNIAINSPESTMFLLLITNNFAEIKSTVFKNFNPISLFVIFASDAVERCYLFFDGLLVILKMSTSRKHLRSYITVFSWLVIIYGLEILIDWFKHVNIIKFNHIKSEAFLKYNSTLVSDTLLSRSLYNLDRLTPKMFEVPCKGSFSFSHISSRRLGFMPSPIVTLIICSLPKLRVSLSLKTFCISVLLWVSLFLFKISTSILLTAYSIKKKDKLQSLNSSFYNIGSL